ncbi:MAG: glycosyltransferase [Fusobacteriaceae bacterium]
MTGIVILNYNSISLVQKLCSNLDNVKEIYKIVIVDNNSTDNSKQKILKLKNFKIDVIFSKKNDGYASGNNIGIKYLMKKYEKIKNICILNPDVEIEDKDIFLKLNQELEKDNSLGIVAPFMLMNGIKNLQLNYWKNPTKFDNLFLILGITNKLYKKLFWKKQVIPGCFLYFSKKLIKDINFLDEETFLYQEENILYKKLELVNKKMKIIENIYYNHNHEHKEKTYKNELFHNQILLESTLCYEKKYNQKYSKYTCQILKKLFYIRKLELFLKHL